MIKVSKKQTPTKIFVLFVIFDNFTNLPDILRSFTRRYRSLCHDASISYIPYVTENCSAVQYCN